MSERLAIGGVVVLIALLAWVTLATDGSPEDIEDSDLRHQESESHPPEPRRLQTAEDSLMSPVEISEESVSDASPLRVAMVIPPGDGPVYQVRDLKTQGSESGVGGAVVHFVDTRYLPSDELALDYLLGLDWEQLLAERGTKVMASVSGHVRLPASPADILLRASHQGRWSAVARCSPRPAAANRDKVLLIHLSLGGRIAVRTVRGGKPMGGVPVALQFDEGSNFTDTRSTNDAGVATFDVSGEALETYRVVFAGVCGSDRPNVRVGVESLETPGDLSLPPTGSVRLRLVDAQDSLCRRPFGVTLSAGFASGSRTTATQSWRVDHGELFVDWVGLGVAFNLGARPLDGSHDPRSLIFPGLAKPGEITTATLIFDRPNPVLEARLFDAQGLPLSHEPIQVSVRDAQGIEHLEFDEWVDEQPVLTGKYGELRVGLRAWDGLLSVQCRLVRVSRDEWGNPILGDRVWVSRLQAQAGGMVRLGDLELTPAPILAEGTIVDGAGTPVQATVSVYRRASRYWKQNRRGDSLPCGKQQSNAVGRFEFRLDYPCRQITVVAQLPSGESVTQDCTPGTTGLRMVIE